MRRAVLIGILLGLVWTAGVLAIGLQTRLPLAFSQTALIGAGFLPGLVLIAMIGRVAMRRFFDEDGIDGAPPASGTAADIDARVLQNTVEQCLLALLIWPLAGFTLGGGLVLVLGVGFAIARLAFWIGYRRSPGLRGFGFAASFYPTVFAALATLYTLIF